ncbi:acetolactate decarboxylase [Companilactobacillus allii]|uniref:Alpha-acetolactate decarboxylase n=1 Tax=Companilactobacillus allii TaxID=1847728 RepID=A0A1P8Q238_9LACO|nr:acetolactate decarboxylase [Companilactobacillus allii]APX71942.1 acetolactate decarboxylase [Companilactobacillus allii]USQ69037.1 acetolactate decarboxylase [Companilactobacillus allii]
MSNTNTLYQHGTLALLVPGLLDGTITMKDLLSHGDTGIGTGEGLDGELIILDGTPYQVDSHGNVNLVDSNFTLPFANSHFADYAEMLEVEDISRNNLQKQITDAAKSSNTFYSVKITGTFKNIKTRAVQKSSQPYQSLAKTAENQSIFTKDSVEGTLLSYYSPAIFDGVAVGGFHSHLMSDEHDFGGHILSFESVSGVVSFQQFDNLEQHLPTDNKEYMEHDFSNDNILDDVHNAEG